MRQVHELEKEDGGLNLFEFVVGNLVLQGAQVYGEPLSFEGHVQPLVNQFYEFDMDKSGSLTQADLVQMLAYSKAQEAATQREKGATPEMGATPKGAEGARRMSAGAVP